MLQTHCDVHLVLTLPCIFKFNLSQCIIFNITLYWGHGKKSHGWGANKTWDSPSMLVYLFHLMALVMWQLAQSATMLHEAVISTRTRAKRMDTALMRRGIQGSALEGMRDSCREIQQLRIHRIVSAASKQRTVCYEQKSWNAASENETLSR
jgi:hypothetical protein